MKKNSIKKIILGAIGVVSAGFIGSIALIKNGTTLYGVPDEGIMDETIKIITFNSQFTNYEGNAITPTQVKTLISVIEASNEINATETSTDKKYVDYIGPEANELERQKKYTVYFNYKDGYIYEVVVKENEDSNATQNNNVNQINNKTENTNEEVIKPIQR